MHELGKKEGGLGGGGACGGVGEGELHQLHGSAHPEADEVGAGGDTQLVRTFCEVSHEMQRLAGEVELGREMTRDTHV